MARRPHPLPVLAALLLAGCAGPAGDPATPETVTSARPAPTVAPVAPATQPDADRTTAVRVIATGRVQAGTGPGCRLLATDQGRTWLLVGGDRAVLAAGARVRVVVGDRGWAPEAYADRAVASILAEVVAN